MYRNCIFCSSPLGSNQSIEHFPVGRRLAFDAHRGRLWVVCHGCARWNLSAIEERWEAVEEAEKLFRASRLRVQSENIGLAKLPDGTRLIRVGEALQGELAAWRYGGQLVARRRRYLVAASAAGVGLAVVGGLSIAGVIGSSYFMWWALSQAWTHRQNRKVVYRLRPDESPSGSEMLIRRWHVRGSYLDEAADGDVALRIPDVTRKDPKQDGWGNTRYSQDVLTLDGSAARTVLGRSMVHVNHKGASQRHVEEALRLLTNRGSAEEYLRRLARSRGVLGKRKDMKDQALTRPGALALEMALHEETERRALQGELVLLESAWREAEEIAAIADALPDDPLRRLRRSR
jgi:hypothetical protein